MISLEQVLSAVTPMIEKSEANVSTEQIIYQLGATQGYNAALKQFKDTLENAISQNQKEFEKEEKAGEETRNDFNVEDTSITK